MSFLKRYLTTLLVSALLIVGVVLQTYVERKGMDDAGAGNQESPSSRLPEALAGYSTRDEPIASTQELKQAVGELLNFNFGLYRIYQRPGVRVSVYFAWWEKGRMSPRLVATHTPDVCWPVNGWARDRGAETGQQTAKKALKRAGFPEGDFRVFRINGNQEQVVFWHKVGTEFLSYKTGWAPPWWAWLDELWRGGLNLREEQLFVRISSDKPFEDFWRTPEFRPLRQALLDLGLGQDQRTLP